MAIKMDDTGSIQMDAPDAGPAPIEPVAPTAPPTMDAAVSRVAAKPIKSAAPYTPAPVAKPYEEDWRRTKQAASKAIDSASEGIKSASSIVMDGANQLGNYLGEQGPDQTFAPPSASEADAAGYPAGSIARRLDSTISRVGKYGVREVAHGIAPQTFDAPPHDASDEQTPGAVTAASIGKDRMMKPVLDVWHQFQRGPGKDFAEFMLQRQGETPENKSNMDVMEYLGRVGFSFIGGEGVMPNEQLTKSYTDSMEPVIEVTGTALVPALMQQLGELPLYLLGTGRGAAAVAEEKSALLAAAPLAKAEETAAALGKLSVKEGAIEGLAQGTVQTMLTPGQDIVSGPLTGYIMGHLTAGMTQTHTGQQTLMNQHSALLPAESWEGFKNEISKLTVKKNGEAVQFVGDGTAHANMRKVEPGDDFVPTFSTVSRDANGKLVGQEVEVRVTNKAPYHGEVAVREVPIDTPAKAREWNKKVNDTGKSVLRAGSSNNQLATKSYAEWMDKAFGEPKVNDNRALPGTDEYSPIEQSLQDPRMQARALQYLKMTPEQIARSKLSTGADLPVILTTDAEANQRMLASIINPGGFKPAETWKIAKGDLVTSPTGESRVVTGFTKAGKVYARKVNAGGKGSIFRNEDLRFIVDKDGITPNKMGPQFLDDAEIKKAINPLERVTIPRAANALSMDPTTATGIIRKMEKAGDLIYRGEGVWDVASRLDQSVINEEPWGRPPEGPRNAPGLRLGDKGARPKGDLTYPALELPGQGKIEEGLEVIIGTDSHGNGVKGVLRGPDPRVPNNYIIEVPKEGLIQQLEAKGALAKMPGTNLEVARSGKETYFKSVPEDSLRSVIPTNLAKKTLQQIIDVPGQYGFNLPHPPGYVVTSSGFQQEVNKVQSILNANRTPTFAGSSRLGKIKETLETQLLNAYYLTPPMLRRLATPLYGTKSFSRELMLRASERLKHGAGAYGNQADRDLIPVIEAAHANGMKDQALVNWSQRYPEEAANVMGTLTNLLDQRKATSDWLGQRGVKSIDMLEQMRGAGEEPEYVTMMYNVHVLKDKYPEWAKKNIPQVWNDAVEYLTKGTRNAQDVESRLAAVLRQSDPGIALAKSGMVDSATAAKLIERKTLPGPIEAILGKVPSASLRLGHTVGYQEGLKKAIETWDAIAASQWWVPDTGTRKQFPGDPSKWSSPRADLQVPVPDKPEFGAAAGGWTHKSLTNFVTKEPMNQTNQFLKMMGFLGGKWKSFHTVYGGPAPWVNNVVRNLKGVVLSGAYEGPEDLEGFRRAPSLLLSYRDNPSTLGPASLVVEAKQYTALSAGFAGAEIHDARTRIQDELLRAMNRAAGNANGMEDMVMAAQDWMRNKQENVKDAYDAIDQYFKMATYINLRKKFIGQGMNIHDAAALSAERINASYPNFELVGPLVEKMRPMAGFGAGYFLSSKAEDMRINAMLAARMARAMNPMSVNDLKLKEPDLLLRLAAAGAMTYGASAMMQSLRRSNGITDQDIEDADSAVALKAKGWSPASVYGWDYDEKGRLVRYDLTPWEDAFTMLRGQSTDPVAARMLHNTVLDLVGDGTWAGRGWTSLANSTGQITPPPQEPRPIGYGEGGILELMTKYAEAGGVPQIFLNVPRALSKSDPHPEIPQSEQWTPGQAMAKAMGAPIAGPVGQGSMMSALMEGKGQIRGLKGEIKKVPRRIGVDEPRADYLIGAKVQGLEGVANRMGTVRSPPGSSIKMDKK